MPTLLHIDSSSRGEASVSRHLTREFAQNWKRANPGGRVVSRDLTASDLPVITPEWVGGAFAPEDGRTPAQVEALAFSDSLISELESADEYVVGVPMYNFAAPAVFKLWIDQIVRSGKTFSYVDGAPVGLLKNKKATFLIASGGVYGAGTAMASFNFVEPYLRTVFGFMGVTDTRSLVAGGVSALTHGKVDRDTFLQPHLESIKAYFPSV